MNKLNKKRELGDIKNYRDMSITVMPSLMCNMRHKFCYQSSFSKNRLPDQILYEKLKIVYPHSGLMTLLGGEITIIPGMKEYIRFLSENYPNLTINIVTNGLEFDEEWIELSCRYNCIVNLSLDATSESATEKIITKGSGKYYWDKIYGSFLKLVEAHEERPTSLINVITIVINDDNIDEIVPFTQLALKHGLNVMFQLPCDQETKRFKRIDESIYMTLKMKFFCRDYIGITIRNIPTYKQVWNIWDSFEKEEVLEEKRQFLQSLGGNIKKAKNKEITIHETIGLNTKALRCDMPWKGLVVMATGDVLPCCTMTNYILGNIYFQSIEEILNGEPRHRLRELIKNNDYRYCPKTCNLNFNPDSSIPGESNIYTPAHKKAFDEGDYKKVIDELKSNQNLESLEPEAIYHYAFSLHMEGEKEEALKYYDLALEKGFLEFWVRYNRGSLYLAMRDYEKSYSDLSRAIQLNPDHEGARSVMEQLGQLKTKHS